MALSACSSIFHFNKHSSTPKSPSNFSIRATSHAPIIRKFQSAANFLILTAATSAVIGKLSHFPARAESTPPPLTEQQTPVAEEEEQETPLSSSPLSEFLQSNSEAVEALKSLLQQKLENGEDEEALQILSRLVSAHPNGTEWKFLMARLYNELGQTENARNTFEEILKINPLSFEALFENAVLMDRCGEGETVITRLGEALRIAEDGNLEKEARDVKMIMAQIQFLQKNVEEALRSYEELVKEDPGDFRPYFCKGMIYSLMDQNAEAKEQFAKYRELSPKKFEVEGFLQTPLSRMKLFGTNDGN